MVEQIVAWLRERVEEAGARGLVCGLSGGIDSAVVGGLAARAFPDSCLGLIMPCHSAPGDAEDAELAAQSFHLPAHRVDLGPVYDALLVAVGDDGSEATRLARANLKPRLRMAALYHHANLNGYLVAGTGNRSELAVGYFTKYGDGGVDLLPLGNLVKHQVRELAQELGVPERIIARAPSAGLWEGQTDEAEMGLSYAELDAYLLQGEAQPAAIRRIQRLHAASEHKRRLPPIFGQS